MTTKLRIHIRQNKDGVIHTDYWSDWRHDRYLWWWTDGNAACDCNRELFFYRAIGEDVSHPTRCTRGRYSICILDDDTDELLYEEFPMQADISYVKSLRRIWTHMKNKWLPYKI